MCFPIIPKEGLAHMDSMMLENPQNREKKMHKPLGPAPSRADGTYGSMPRKKSRLIRRRKQHPCQEHELGDSASISHFDARIYYVNNVSFSSLFFAIVCAQISFLKLKKNTVVP